MFGMRLGLGLGSGQQKSGAPYTAEAQAYIQRVEADGGVVQNPQTINTAYKLFRTNLVWGIMIDGGIKREAGSPSYVEKVYDLATTARDCMQGTPAARPFFVENAIGDKPGIRFSGAQFMEFGNDNLINTAQPFTLVAVFLPKAISNIGSTQYGLIACIRTELSTGMYEIFVTGDTVYKLFSFGHASGARLRIDNSTLFAVNTPIHAQIKYNGSGFTNADGKLLNTYNTNSIYIQKQQTSLNNFQDWSDPGHTLMVNKPGYKPSIQDLSFTEDKTVVVNLQIQPDTIDIPGLQIGNGIYL